MGLPHASARVNRLVKPGKETSPIFLDNVKCDVDEKNILDCQRSNKDHNCDHTEDVGVYCISPDECSGPNQFRRDIGKGYCAVKLPGCVKQGITKNGTEVCVKCLD